MWILISWLHQKPADLDLHCFPVNFIGKMNLSCRLQTMWILISWLHQKPANLDLHCFPVNFIGKIDLSCRLQIMCILISWLHQKLHQKPADLDLHCFPKRVCNYEIVMHTVNGWIFTISKIVNFLKSNLKTCSMPTNINNFKFKWSIVNR